MLQSNTIKAGIGYTIGNYLLKGLTFFSIPIFARLLDPSDYGIVNTYNAYESITWMLIGFCLHSCLKRAKVRYEQTFNQFMSFCVVIVLLNTFIWLIVGYFFRDKIINLIQFDKNIIILLILQSSAGSLIQIFNSYAALYYNYYGFLGMAGANTILNISLSVWFIVSVFAENKAIGRILGGALPSVLIGLFICCYFLKKGKPNICKDYLKFSFSYCLPIIPHGISQIILSQFDRIMISSMIGTLQSGIYSFAYNIYSIIMVTASSLETVWSTWFFEQMKAKRENMIRKKANDFAYGILLFCVFVLLISPEIINLLGADKYAESVYSVTPIVIGGYFAFLYYLPASIEYYFEKTKFIAIGSLTAALLNIILNYIFIERYGYIAAAYTTMVTYLIYFIFHYYIAKKILGRCIFDSKKIILFSIAIVVAGCFSILFLEKKFVRLCMFICMFIYALFLLKNYFYDKQTLNKGVKNV